MKISEEWRRRSLVWGVLALAAILRLTALGHWPTPQHDEGLWTISAKNFVLFGDWFLDDHGHFFLSPLFHGVAAGLFELGEPSIALGRLVSALSGVASVGLIYLLVKRLSGRWLLGLVTGLMLAVSEFAIFHSRLAVIEPLQVFLFLAVAYCLEREGGVWRAGAILVLGAALVAKISSAVYLPIAALLLWTARSSDGSSMDTAGEIARLLFGAMALGATAYGVLYLWMPHEFLAAFTYELDGVHFESLSRPLIRIGRFGFDPGQAADSVMLLFRQMPVIMTLCVLGVSASWNRPSRLRTVMGTWLILGSAFYLVQMYQPTRYFYLVFPAVIYFAAFTVLELTVRGNEVQRRLASRMEETRRLAIVLCGIAGFELLYVIGGGVTNSNPGLNEIDGYFSSVPSGAEVLARPYLCVDIPQRCYSSAEYEASRKSLQRRIEKGDIDYVIAGAERTKWRMMVDENEYCQAVARTPLGTIYRVADAAG